MLQYRKQNKSRKAIEREITIKTTVYLIETEDYNAVVIDQQMKGHWFFDCAPDGRFDGIDIYAIDAADRIAKLFHDNIDSGILDLSSCCDQYNNSYVNEPFNDHEYYDRVTVCIDFEYDPLLTEEDEED